jgi:hypothetical protein
VTGPTLPLDGVTSDQHTARCPGCLRVVELTPRGLLAAHGPVIARCPAGGLRPAQAIARLAAHATHP